LTLHALPYVATLGFLFGSTLIASRFSVGQFAPLIYIGLRLALSSSLHLGAYLILGRPWPRDRSLWGRAMLYGLFGTAVPLVGIVSSLEYQSSGVTSILIAVGPAFTVVLAHFFLPAERLTRRTGLGVGLAFAGAVLLALRGETGLPEVREASPIGYVLVLGADLSISAAAVYARRTLRGMGEFDVASVRMFTATALVLPLALLIHGLDLEGVDGRGYFALGYAALAGTFGGMLLSFYILKRFGATASAMHTYLIPIVASLGGALLLEEQITSAMVLGMASILAGIALINRWGGGEGEPKVV
jgi:drug/metabolite transporter (DMT)-like permease